MLNDSKFTKNCVTIAWVVEYFENLNDLGSITDRDKKSYFEIGTTGEKKRYKTRLIIQTSAQFLVEYNQNYNYEIKLEL